MNHLYSADEQFASIRGYKDGSESPNVRDPGDTAWMLGQAEPESLQEAYCNGWFLGYTYGRG